jgi:hypothetical protein
MSTTVRDPSTLAETRHESGADVAANASNRARTVFHAAKSLGARDGRGPRMDQARDALAAERAGQGP